MIYRRWSLLTSTAAIAGGVVAAVVAANIIADPFLKQDQKKKTEAPSK
ncbi:hypothetical protein vseg_009392 [Gypsophila vaccaria]